MADWDEVTILKKRVPKSSELKSQKVTSNVIIAYRLNIRMKTLFNKQNRKTLLSSRLISEFCLSD